MCDDSLCSVYIPLRRLRAGCEKLQSLHASLALEYECDPEDLM